MNNLYTVKSKLESHQLDLSKEEIASVLYHNIFDYPINLSDLIKWKSGVNHENVSEGQKIVFSKGFYFAEGKEGLIYKRLLRTRISEKKLQIAKKTSKLLSNIPFIKMIAVTGSLAMKNSDEGGDIDLFIITKKGTLWTTRAITLVLLKILNIPTRRFGDKNQKDKVCLNMWMDESDLVWSSKNRNAYTSHEIAQAIPLINKDKTYEYFLMKNSWILKFWPQSVKINKVIKRETKKLSTNFIEKIFFDLQFRYMKNKISREVVKKTKAFFHPQDWGKFVEKRLTS